MHSLNEHILNSLKDAFLLEDYKSAKIKLIEKGSSSEEADNIVSKHKELKRLNRLKPEHIDIDKLVKYNDFEQVKKILSSYNTRTKVDVFKELEKKIVAENEDWIVYKIDTPKEAYAFHGRTHWCISSGTKTAAAKYFDSYNKNKNTFYFYVRKNPIFYDREPERWNYIALERRGEKNIYWDIYDDPCDSLPSNLNVPTFEMPPLKMFPPERDMRKSGIKFQKLENGEYDIFCDLNRTNLENLFDKDGKLRIKINKVEGIMDISNCPFVKLLENFPREVTKSFWIRNNNNITSLVGSPEIVGNGVWFEDLPQLKTLEGGPKHVGKYYAVENCLVLKSLKGCVQEAPESFSCSRCISLSSLEYAPQKVGDFNCSECSSITSLNGISQSISGKLICDSCKRLKSLEGCPDTVGGDFSVNGCWNLKDLKGGPRKVGGNFDCSGCESLKDLIGAPEVVGGNFDCSYCSSLINLKGAPKSVNDFDFSFCDHLQSLKGLPKNIAGRMNLKSTPLVKKNSNGNYEEV